MRVRNESSWTVYHVMPSSPAYCAIAAPKGPFPCLFVYRVEMPYISHYGFPNCTWGAWLCLADVHRGSRSVCFIRLCEFAFDEDGEANIAQCDGRFNAIRGGNDELRPRLDCPSIKMDDVIIYNNLNSMLQAR